MSETTSATRRRLHRPGLALQLAFVLSLAILPLGLISVYQTYKLIEERQSLSGSALLEETQQAVAVARNVISAAASTAETLSITIPAVRDTQETCDAVLARVVAQNRDFVFAGYVDSELGLVCNSDNSLDVTGLDALEDEILRPEPGLFVRSFGFLAGRATLNVTVPVMEAGVFRGVAWVSVPLVDLNAALKRAAPDVELVLFQPGGDVLATENFTDDRRSVLPSDRALDTMAMRGRHTFRGYNRAGALRDFAVAPIVEDEVFVMGSWAPRHRGLLVTSYAETLALYFPIFIWVIAIAVAYVGVHRLVIRHIRRLRSWMRLYAQGQTDFANARLDNPPLEVEYVAEAFRAMTERLGEQDRRRQEDLEEKTVLLREVHHRVKNNLQLIASMMNMQIRATTNPGAKHLLRRVQDRVMALSAIHRYLYMARKLSMVRADKLLEDIIEQQVALGSLEEAGHSIAVSTKLDPVEITPDQSVPLSLMVAEAAINAVKHCDVDKDTDGAWINIALQEASPGVIGLSVVNSRLKPEGEPSRPEGTGLGSKLIETFVIQLNGKLETVEEDNRFELHVTFPLAWPKEGDDDDDN
ncbi:MULTISPECIES: sensor histidine kinase [Marinovum]|uniref:sensor histidine kinase n=1 Tax=Marinovum TaxID=367771 RepID=UPI00237A16FD|nr:MULTISPECIES: sensor histidine kinase [Marinovum]MDD9741580.1 sensor histidine kinase [Marinovum sp. SP66]